MVVVSGNNFGFKKSGVRGEGVKKIQQLKTYTKNTGPPDSRTGGPVAQAVLV